MTSRHDITAMSETPEREEAADRGMPRTLWRHADGTITADHPERYWEYQDYIREDIGRAHIDRLSELCGYAISQWEDWVRDQLEGTSHFADAMAEIAKVRSAATSSERSAALAQMESNDG